MNSKKLHRIAGLILVLPMIGWVVTGMIFFIKPGYQGAYEQLKVKTYPIDADLVIKPALNWQEIKMVKTVLGHHLLVKIDGQTYHLEPSTLTPKKPADIQQVKQLVDDAISQNRARYGQIVELTEQKITTDTGVTISFDWLNLTLRQSGNDTQLINLLYKIHYLQWTTNTTLDQILGILGLALLLTLTALGLRLYLKKSKL